MKKLILIVFLVGCGSDDSVNSNFKENYIEACKNLCKTDYHDNPLCGPIVSGDTVECDLGL